MVDAALERTAPEWSQCTLVGKRLGICPSHRIAIASGFDGEPEGRDTWPEWHDLGRRLRADYLGAL